MNQPLARDKTILLESARILARCCKSQSSALVILPLSPAMIQGKFVQLTPPTLTLELLDVAQLRAMSLCCVSFAHRGRAHVFMSRVQEVVRTERVFVDLEIPEHVSAAETRSMFRIPTAVGVDLTAELLEAEGPTEVVPIDLSLRGIRIAMEDERAVPTVDAAIKVRLTSGGHRVDMEGRVRNRYETQCGINFADTVDGDDLEPPRAYRDLVRHVEMQWIRHRRQLEQLQDLFRDHSVDPHQQLQILKRLKWP